MEKDIFEEYIKHTEPEKKEKAYAWSIGIGLQDVDGIKPSKYLIETAKQNIEGEISLEQAEKMITAYYEEKPSRDELQELLQNLLFLLHQMNIYLFTIDYLKVFTLMQDK